MIDPEDAARELDKAADHLAETVRPTPLGVRVETAAVEARRAAERFRGEN